MNDFSSEKIKEDDGGVPANDQEELTPERVTADLLDSASSIKGPDGDKMDKLFLREWNPLTSFLKQIPPKAQKGLVTLDLNFTTVAAVEEYIAVGTNVGLVYWYNRKTDVLDRLRTENNASPISCMGLVSTVDFMLAAGNQEGVVTIFQIPKAPTPNTNGNDFERFVNNNLWDKNGARSIQRFDVFGLHKCRITALEWSSNGMKLFSGDASGTVVLTDIDFEVGTVQSRPIYQENFEIVQLSYLKKYLLICSTLQSLIYSLESNETSKVGTQDRKIQGRFGGIFRKNVLNETLKLFSVRPGGRLWLADVSGMVEHTIKFKDLLLERNYSNIPVIQPSLPSALNAQDFQIGYLQRVMSNLLVTFNKNVLYILDPLNTRILGSCRELKGILQVAVNASSDEIFILETERNLIRLSTTPDTFIAPTSHSRDFMRNIPYKIMSSSMADFRLEIEQPLNFITSKIKETSRLVPKMNSSLMNTLKQVIEADVIDGQTVIPLPDTPVIAVESYEPKYSILLPPIVPDKFEHISRLPFDDVLLVPPKVKRKRERRKPKSRDALFQSSGDTTSLSSSTYSVNSDEDKRSSRTVPRLSADIRKQGKDFPLGVSMSQSWSVGEGVGDKESEIQTQDLESKEEILARKLNWPELLPESRRSIVEFEMNAVCNANAASEEMEKLELRHESDNDDSSSLRTLRETKYNSSTSLENIPVLRSTDTLVCQTSLDSTHVTPISDIFEESIDIYTKYAPKEEFNSITSALSFGPPSTNSTSYSSGNGYSTGHWGHTDIIQPKIVETDENTLSNSPTTDLVPVRDMIVEPHVDTGNGHWLSYAAPAPLQSVAACDKFVVCTDKKNCVYVSELNDISLRWVQAKYHASHISISPCGSVFWRLVKGTVYSLMDPNPKTTIVEGSSWSKICSSVISMCIQMHVGWIVKQDGSVFICSGLLTTAVVPDFDRVPCPFQMSRIVAVDNNVWGISQDGRLFFRNGVTEDRLIGTGWVEKYFESSSLSSMVSVAALGPAGSLWIGDVHNNLYFMDGLSDKNYEGQPYHWRISLGDYLPCSEVNDGRLGSDGGSSGGASFSLTSLKNKLSESLNPEKISNLWSSRTGPIVSGTETAVWFSVIGSVKVYVNKSVIEGHRWVSLSVYRPMRKTAWANAMAGSIYRDHGFLWLLDPKGKLFYCKSNGGDAKSIDLPCSSPLSCVAPAPDALWILNREGVIYARANISTENSIGHGWMKIDLSSQERFLLTHISCGSDVAWGCDIKGKVFMRVGNLRPSGPNEMSPPWVPVDDDASVPFYNSVFTKVYVGTNGSMVWALDNKNNIYVREAIFSDFPIGTRWLLVSGVEAISLTLSEQAVYALSPKGEIFRRYGISSTNFVGEYWKKIPGPYDSSVQVVTASLCDEIWAIDNLNQLIKHSQNKLNAKDYSTPRKTPKIVLDPEDKDWVVV